MKSDKHTFWERVISDNYSALEGFLRRRVALACDAQDLAQEVYVRLLHIDEKRAKTITNPRAYLYTVASNLVKENIALQKRRALGTDISQVFPEMQAPGGSAEDETEREFRRRRIVTTLNRLPPRCKAVLLMQHRDGMSYAEIAARLGVSSHMVKKYVVKALALCRKELAETE